MNEIIGGIIGIAIGSALVRAYFELKFFIWNRRENKKLEKHWADVQLRVQKMHEEQDKWEADALKRMFQAEAWNKIADGIEDFSNKLHSNQFHTK